MTFDSEFQSWYYEALKSNRNLIIAFISLLVFLVAFCIFLAIVIYKLLSWLLSSISKTKIERHRRGVMCFVMWFTWLKCCWDVMRNGKFSPSPCIVFSFFSKYNTSQEFHQLHFRKRNVGRECSISCYSIIRKESGYFSSGKTRSQNSGCHPINPTIPWSDQSTSNH